MPSVKCSRIGGRMPSSQCFPLFAADYSSPVRRRGVKMSDEEGGGKLRLFSPPGYAEGRCSARADRRRRKVSVVSISSAFRLAVDIYGLPFIPDVFGACFRGGGGVLFPGHDFGGEQLCGTAGLRAWPGFRIRAGRGGSCQRRPARTPGVEAVEGVVGCGASLG